VRSNEQEIADAKAIIGRDGIGCEPASATTVAGVKRLISSGFIGPAEDVVAVLTGHILKDTDYAINYHRSELYVENENQERQRLAGSYTNPPTRVEPTKAAILAHLRRME
jgi:threonine synthase